ncbi:D-alanine aminotransferase [Mesobacillus campisalis]|uniref:D-alanine aminotransferase n=1 Tax=Mesobacillus campisalis TaxID=1408103 RepID=A0A0M2SXI0_9BACI|nr:D-amino-acid transaminase [Mesobacillus campisalis]KKK38406.1 D-alanine aminotransferase [Mesobacillus campisalis]
MEYVMFNGEIVERKAAAVDIEDRGYQFGDGIYEVIRIYNGLMFTAEEHLQRLDESAASIGIEIPYAREDLQIKLESLIAHNGVRFGTVYLQFTRGNAPRKHPFPVGAAPTFVAYTREAGRPEEKLQSGVKTILIEDIRWLRCDIKSLNLLGNLLANQKAAEAGCDEAIQHRDGKVTEGSHSNVSIVKGGTVITHPANNYILNGISRRVMLEICRKEGIPVEERVFSVAELEAADEVFLTGTTIEVMPVIEHDGRTVGNGVPGAVTRKLQQEFRTEIEKQCGAL